MDFFEGDSVTFVTIDGFKETCPMSTRNPMNDRYKSDETKPVGKTRKSAASAKPVSKAASSVRMETKGSDNSKSGLFGKRKSSAGNRDRLVPDTPEYKKWHKIWIGVIVAAIALTLIGLFARNLLHASNVAMGLVIVGDVLLVASILIDILKLSKMRTAYAKQVRMSKSKANKAKVREANAQAKENANSSRAKEIEAVQKAKADKPKKKSLNPFSTKNI